MRKSLFALLAFAVVFSLFQVPKNADAASCQLFSPVSLGSYDLNGDGIAESLYQERVGGTPQPYLTVVDLVRGCTRYNMGTSQFAVLSAVDMDNYPGKEVVLYPKQANGTVMFLRHYTGTLSFFDMRWKPGPNNTNPIYGWVTVAQLDTGSLYQLVSETDLYSDTSGLWRPGGVKVYSAKDNKMWEFTLPLDAEGMYTSSVFVGHQSYLVNYDGQPGLEVVVDYTYTCATFGCSNPPRKHRDIVTYRTKTVTKIYI